MNLEDKTLQALNIFPTQQQPISLMKLFNCKTTNGTQMLKQWLSTPLMDKQEIEIRQDLVQFFMDNEPIRCEMRDVHYRAIPDVKKLSQKLSTIKCSLADMCTLYDLVQQVPQIVDCLAGDSDVVATNVVQPLEQVVDQLTGFTTAIEKNVDLEAVKRHEFIVRCDLNEHLLELKQKMDETMDEIDSERQQCMDMISSGKDCKVKNDFSDKYGYHMRVSRNDARLLSEIEHQELSVQKDGVHFTTSLLKQLSAAYLSLSNDYAAGQKDIVKQLALEVQQYFDQIYEMSQLLATLDVILTFATTSLAAPLTYVRPQIKETGAGDLILKNSRHPLIESLTEHQFISNDVELKRDQSEFVLVTGPNTCGKSTWIKQTAVIVILAQVGCFVPCSEAQVPIFDNVLCRIGAGDVQLKGVSTFMAEMLESAEILKKATSNSLVIIDELGRGSSTFDGFGLAWAISEDLIKRRVFSLFATHFHELTMLSKEYQTVRNVHVVAHLQDKEIGLTYKVTDGVCDDSFGLNVARIAQFPEQVVAMAEKKVTQLESGSSNPLVDAIRSGDVQLVQQLLDQLVEAEM